MLQMPTQAPPIDRGIMPSGTGGDTASVEADILPIWDDWGGYHPLPWMSPLIVS
jgi:hypothetical protein